MNHAEVVAEDERKKRPQNFEAKRKRQEWEDEQETKKKVCFFHEKNWGIVGSWEELGRQLVIGRIGGLLVHGKNWEFNWS